MVIAHAMDLIAHAVYGATACSRTGLAGGLRGPAGAAGRRWFADWTVWCAGLFGILPDVLSMGLPLLAYVRAGMHGNFFRNLGPADLESYRYLHSLLAALAAAGLLRVVCRPLFAPALAWPLHVVMDAFTHGAGKFQTTLFYPLTAWGFEGIPWWRHPHLVTAYWLILPAVWIGLWFARRRWGPGWA
jgi:hypothetical protein